MLARWTSDVAIGAEHATVARDRPKHVAAPLAVVKELTSVGRHFFLPCMATLWTGDRRKWLDYFTHDHMVISVVPIDSSGLIAMSDNRLSIGKVASQTGCHIETIRFYEKESLLPLPDRTEGGHRLYTTKMVERLVFIRRSRELGFSMVEIRQLLSVVDGEHVSCERVKHIADDHLRDIRSKIADLRKMARTLSELSTQCSGNDVPVCPIIEVLSAKRLNL